MIYIDSDGVLSDFDQWLIDMDCKDHNSSKEVYKTIIKHQDGAFVESKKIKKNNWIFNKMKGDEDFRVLTSMPEKEDFRKFFKSDDAFNACYNKLKENKYKWFDNHGISRDKIIIVDNREDKYNYCTPDSILYDDFPKTVKEWTKRGGKAVLVTNHKCWAQFVRYEKYAKNNFEEVRSRIKKGLLRFFRKSYFNVFYEEFGYDNCMKLADLMTESVYNRISGFIYYNPTIGKCDFECGSTVNLIPIVNGAGEELRLGDYMYNCFPRLFPSSEVDSIVWSIIPVLASQIKLNYFLK